MHITERAHAGTPFGGFLEKNSSPSTPSGKRCNVTGRSPTARISPSATEATYVARSHFVIPASGHMTRSGLDTRTSRTLPSGAATCNTFALLAIGRA